MDKPFKAEIAWQRNEKGVIITGSQANVRLALSEMKVRLSYNEFADRLLCVDGNGSPRFLDDAKMDRLWLRLDDLFGWRPPKELFITIVCDLARQNAFHPVREYLDQVKVKWDGKGRLNSWLADYGGAERNDYTAAVGMLTLVAAVRRVRQPGCKFDEMPVLESPQGLAEKSSAIAALCPEEAWFSDDMPLNIGSKEVIERSRGHWIIEAAELSGMSRGDVEHLKAFMSRQVDKARLAYDRMTTERPRQFIVIGTTNSGTYLRDSTGNRRFWPVTIRQFDIEGIKRDRDQLWAEAAAREAAGQSIRLDKALWRDAAKEQEERRMVDPWEETISDVLGDPVTGEMQTGKIETAEVWTIVRVEPGHQTQDQNARLGQVMRRLGYERKKLRPVNTSSREGDRPPVWHYARGTADEQQRGIIVGMKTAYVVPIQAEPPRSSTANPLGGTAEVVESHWYPYLVPPVPPG